MKALLVAGLGYGDEGKGSIVDYLTRVREATEVVRYNGGPQAAHNVLAPDGRHHTFSQFGSGTLAGARTYLSRNMLVNPLNLFTEAIHLLKLGVEDPFSRLTVSADCLIVTPWHVALNRLREQHRIERHGSCGEGVGECVQDSLNGHELRARDLRDLSANELQVRLSETRERLRYEAFNLIARAEGRAAPNENHETFSHDDNVIDCRDTYKTFADWVRIEDEHEFEGTVIFEGAQGVLLDERYGFPPYHTWSNTTLGNAQALVDEHAFEEVERIGVTRAYMTRHGAGPFVTETVPWTRAERIIFDATEHNMVNEWQGNFRVGEFDPIALRYALDVCGGVDYLAVTCLDHTHDDSRLCVAYEFEGHEVQRIAPAATLRGQADLTEKLFDCEPVYADVGKLTPDDIGAALDTEVGIASYGPMAEQKRAYGVTV